MVMGCTEIPLILSQEDTDVPLLDSTRLLAKAALKEVAGQSAQWSRTMKKATQQNSVRA